MREPREKIKDQDLLLPIDIYKLGSKDDPCFGKLHDLKATECNVCGDADFCAIIKAQNLHGKREAIEKENEFKDLEETEYVMGEKRKGVIKFIKEKKRESMSPTLIKVRGRKQFNLPKEVMEEIYQSLNI